MHRDLASERLPVAAHAQPLSYRAINRSRWRLPRDPSHRYPMATEGRLTNCRCARSDVTRADRVPTGNKTRSQMLSNPLTRWLGVES